MRPKKAIIWTSIDELADWLKTERKNNLWTWRSVATSGGFDPLTFAHARCIQCSAKLGESLTVIVNGDGFLTRKKKYAFMPLNERMEIIASISGVDHVVSWDDGTQFVDGALAILRPDIFAKGGDRSRESAIASAELVVCEKVGCKIVYGVGGEEKDQSSSFLCSRLLSMKTQIVEGRSCQ